jgi:hypothetical protein
MEAGWVQLMDCWWDDLDGDLVGTIVFDLMMLGCLVDGDDGDWGVDVFESRVPNFVGKSIPKSLVASMLKKNIPTLLRLTLVKIPPSDESGACGRVGGSPPVPRDFA